MVDARGAVVTTITCQDGPSSAGSEAWAQQYRSKLWSIEMFLPDHRSSMFPKVFASWFSPFMLHKLTANRSGQQKGVKTDRSESASETSCIRLERPTSLGIDIAALITAGLAIQAKFKQRRSTTRNHRAVHGPEQFASYWFQPELQQLCWPSSHYGQGGVL